MGPIHVQYSTVGICVSFVGATFYRLFTRFLFTVCIGSAYVNMFVCIMLVPV